MSKKPAKRARRSGPPPEARRAEVATVGWMLAVFTALVCELGFTAARLYLALADPDAGAIQALAVLLLFAALVVGTTSVILGVAVVRWRRTRPPQGILLFGFVIGAAPLVAVALLALAAIFAPAG